MNYQEAREYLTQISAKGNLLGLTSMKNLLDELGNPQDQLRFVHVGGTNGKGSVMSYLETILIRAGYKVGRYLSPVLFCYEEKIQINGEYIDQNELAEYTGMIFCAMERLEARKAALPTIFEVETAISFLHFVRHHCDIVLLEVGMGGREDATNLVKTTLVEVITSISLDHMEFLGDTLEKIARVKAGIIKSGSVCVSDAQCQEVTQVLREECSLRSVPLHMVCPEQITNVSYGLTQQTFDYVCRNGNVYKDMKIHLAGTCQIRNAAAALEAVEALKEQGFGIPYQAALEGLDQTRWEGRFSILHEQPYVIMDGAHNPDAAEKLMDALDTYFEGRRIFYIFGVFSDKEYDKIIDITAGRAYKIYTIETKNNPRALPAEKLAEAVRRVNPHVQAVGDAPAAIEKAMKEANKEDVILFFGSLSHLWEAKEYFRSL